MTEIPINTSSVAAVIIAPHDEGYRLLLLRRAGDDYWCHVAGRIEEGEAAVTAVAREITEETGLTPESLYSADHLFQFYDPAQNRLNLVPLFVAFADAAQEVVLNEEHTEYRWCALDEAKLLTPYPNQHQAYDHVWTNFCQTRPPDRLQLK